MKTITKEWLKEQGACSTARRLFVRKFGDKAKITAKSNLSAYFIAYRIFTPKQLAKFKKYHDKQWDRRGYFPIDDSSYSEIEWAAFAAVALGKKLKRGKSAYGLKALV